MTCEQILEIVRNPEGRLSMKPGDGYLMGHRLSEFKPEEQAEILLWALETEQQRSANLQSAVEMLNTMARRNAQFDDSIEASREAAQSELTRLKKDEPLTTRDPSA